MKKIFILSGIAFLFTLVVMVACDKPTPHDKVEFELSKSTYQMTIGQTFKLEVTPQDLADKVVWSSHDPAVATVNKGQVYALTVGETTIHATIGDTERSCTVKVIKMDKSVNSVKLDQTALTLKPGETAQLTATTDPEGKHVIWTSEDESIVTIVDGKVTALAIGATNVVATAGEKSARCYVDVTDGSGGSTGGTDIPTGDFANYPAKIVVRTHFAHSHGGYIHGNAAPENNPFPLSYDQSITYKFSSEQNGYVLEGDQPFRWIKGGMWMMEVKLFDHEGNSLDAKYGAKGDNDRHQFFIHISDLKNIKTGKSLNKTEEEVLTKYFYRDTNPVEKMWNFDSGVTLTKNPVGLKGVFGKGLAMDDWNGIGMKYVSFNLNYTMIDFGNAAAKQDQYGEYRSAYTPLSQSMKEKVVFTFAIPIRIISERPGGTSDFFIEDIAEEYGITDLAGLARAYEELLDLPDNMVYYM